ncbi:MAG: IPT/TIG domain-containing protein [Gammaproteobacteria bacterium]|nr:IPT/TIG domain-containing protein [Gammaproteobacteria bacterium]
MAAPSISSITPETAPGDGTVIAHIYGSGFADDVEVVFGEVSAEVMGRIVSDGSDVAIVRVPKFATSAAKASRVVPGVVDVSVQNLDGAGAPVPGEVDVLVDGFTYITLTEDVKASGFVGVDDIMARLVLMLRREVLSKATIGVAVDYDVDGDGARAIVLADPPSLLLSLTRAVRRRDWRQMSRRWQSAAAGAMTGVLESRAPAMAYDLEMTLAATTKAEDKRLLQHLVSAIARFLSANPYVYILDDEFTPSEGGSKWPLEARDSDIVLSSGQRPNVAVWNLVVRGVQLDEGRALVRTRAVDDTIIGVDEF